MLIGLLSLVEKYVYEMFEVYGVLFFCLYCIKYFSKDIFNYEIDWEKYVNYEFYSSNICKDLKVKI